MRKMLLISAAMSLSVAAVQTHADGAAIYNSGCMACHASGVAGSPKVGDKEAWVDRIAQGAELLYEHAIVGYQGKNGYMPPKGGFAHLSDEDVKAAVDYMVSQSQ